MTSLQELIFKSPDPLDAVMKLGKAIAESRMFGAGSPMQGVIIVTHCLDKGIALLDWVAEYHLMDVNGKVTPTMKADAMLARFESNGGSFVWVNDASDGKEAVLTLRKDSREQTVRYTIDDARTAKLIKADGNWVRNAPAMLRARAVSSGLTMFNPSMKVGVYTPEELEEIGSNSVSSDPVSVEHSQAPQDATPADAKPRRGRPAGSKNRESGAADGSVAASVETGTVDAARDPATTAAPTAAESAAQPVQSPSDSTSVAAPAPSNEATTAVDESRFAQVQFLERQKAKFYGLTLDKLKEMNVPDDIADRIMLNDEKWAKLTQNATSSIIAEMSQEELDGLETQFFKNREERLQKFIGEKDIETFLNNTINGKK